MLFCSWKIETPAQSWYDDYVDWLSPQGSKSCCAFNQTIVNGSITKTFCPSTYYARKDCKSCFRSIGNDDYTPEEFMEYLPWFKVDNPGVNCNKG